MKKLKYIILSISLLVLNACNELDDIEATFRADEETVIVSEASANSILNEIYARTREPGVHTMAKLQSAMGLSDNDSGQSSIDEIEDFVTNVPNIESPRLATSYSAHYGVIQQASSFIEAMDFASPSILGGEVNKNSLIGEARFVRGLMHFYLLRAFGEFYDTSSDFGIILRMTSARDASIPPRNTVAESYAAIYEDLDFAIENCTSTERFRASVNAAKAIKAKVLLYEGRFSEAATLSAEVLASTAASFPDDYSVNYGVPPAPHPIFGFRLGNAISFTHDSPEIIFSAFTSEDTREDPTFFRPILPGSIYASIARPNPSDNSTWDPRSIEKYEQIFYSLPDFSQAFFLTRAQIHMRLAELYLIHAEASARIGSGADASAVANLNAVRTRTAVSLPALNPATKAELLEAIRVEKLLDLYGENGEDFFDLIRYELQGDLVASSIKSTMTNEDFYIFPIPRDELLLVGSENLVQNPGYDRL